MVVVLWLYGIRVVALWLWSYGIWSCGIWSDGIWSYGRMVLLTTWPYHGAYGVTCDHGGMAMVWYYSGMVAHASMML